jgi:TonB family protein
MIPLETSKFHHEDLKILKWSFLGALVFEFVALTFLGIQQHWLAHPQKTTGIDSTKFIEAEVYKLPLESHLMEEKKSAPPKVKEVTLSKKVDQGRKETPEEKSFKTESNDTNQGPKMAADHGPVAIFSPPPIIPSYLQNKDISASVVIEFLVNNQGKAIPKLIGSSGDEELDALAISSTQKWQFRPAEHGHKPIDSKIRLRINFSVN